MDASASALDLLGADLVRTEVTLTLTLTLARNAQAASRTTSGSAEGRYRGDVGEI